MTLIALIFMAQVFYTYVVDNIEDEVVRRELRDIADYVADTVTNLYFLVNSTETENLSKVLDLPSNIRDLTYVVEIRRDDQGFASYICAYIKEKSWINATSWLPSGLKVDEDQTKRMVESGGKEAVVRCYREDGGIFVWLMERE